MSGLVLFSCLVTFSVLCTDGARILAVFPTPSLSHQVVFRPLTQALAKRGHEVVVMTTDPVFVKEKAPANLTEIDLHKAYEIWGESLRVKSSGKAQDLYTQIKIVLDLVTASLEILLQSNEVQSLLKDEQKKFDLLLLEAWVKPTLIFSHIYKVPVIQVSSLGDFGNFDIIGAPTHPLLYSSSLRQRLYNLTVFEKISELYNHFSMNHLILSHEKEENEMLQRVFGQDIPPLEELRNNVHMLFMGVHSIWDGNRPVPPGVVFMGGLHQLPEKELPKDLKSYLDSSANGVIYMSFGTNTNPSFLRPEIIQKFVRVFSRLPYDVLWKWDKDELPGQSKNIKTSKWFPQSDLLRHPNVKLFITQGGLQSTDEAITAGVPLIGIPMLGDQWNNVEKYVYHKIGLRLDVETFTEEQLRNSINTVMGDKSYSRAVSRLRSFMRDLPEQPLARAVWWTEHVLRHGGATHLRAPAANMSWREYLELDLVLIVLSGALAVIVILVLIARKLLALLFSVFCNKTKKD